MKTIIVSDMHLGDGTPADDFAYRSDRKIKNVDRDWINWHIDLKADLTILNGDILELWQFSRAQIERAHASLLNYLKGINAIWLIGNHDYDPRGRWAYDFVAGGLRYHVEHGFRNDKEMLSPWVRAGVFAMGVVERLAPDVDKLDHYFKRSSVGAAIERNTRILAHTQLASGKNDVVIYGHTHKIGEYLDKHYLNSGTCVEGRHEAVVVTDDGYAIVME